MAPRDPTKPQLDFPALVADLIEELRLTGQVGLLDFLDAVRPVYIVAAREGALAFSATGPTFTSAGITGTSADNPALNVIVGDTGPLAAGDYDIWANMSMAIATTGIGPIELQHRNAANTATLAVLLHLHGRAGDKTLSNQLPLIGYTVGLNERFRFQVLVAGIAGSVGTVIGLQIRPTP